MRIYKTGYSASQDNSDGKKCPFLAAARNYAHKECLFIAERRRSPRIGHAGKDPACDLVLTSGVGGEAILVFHHIDANLYHLEFDRLSSVRPGR